MYIIFIIVSAVIFLRNPFSKKKYQTFFSGKAILVFRSNPEIVIYDYHYYVLSLLENKLFHINKRTVVYFECPGLSFLKSIFPALNIFLQIEHTLLKPEIGSSLSAQRGNLLLLDGDQKYLVRIAEYEKLNSADAIFDYSRINLLNIKSSPSLKQFSKKTYCVSPSLYPIWTDASNRSGIITLFGNPNASRRKNFLDMLVRHNIEYENILGVYFGVNKIYQKAKIVVNIRQTDSYDTLEELRVLPALRSGAIVVCESAPYVEKTAYSKFIIWGALHDLPRIIVEIEQNYEKVHQRIFGDGSQSSSFAKRMRRIEKCNMLSVNRAIAHINGQ
jgi:hypothetical protein